MRKFIQFGLLVCSASAMAGCATWATGSAPAGPGYVYVTGHKNNMPAIWMCPDAPGKAECSEVEITEAGE
ncbi:MULTISPECIES: hypothetical protein [Sorangium]|uniref:hypothetical protein n=1 Tax=Sorangium TaxID=39643 RepID=UPI000AEB9B96|nr:hypothetical protein [Sorangium cellulosum]